MVETFSAAGDNSVTGRITTIMIRDLTDRQLLDVTMEMVTLALVAVTGAVVAMVTALVFLWVYRASRHAVL